MTLFPQTRFLSSKLRALTLISSATLTTAMMFSAGSATAANGPDYRAELETPVEKTTEIIRGVIWTCEGTSCTGANANSRPVYSCARLVSKMGGVTRFATQGEDLDSKDLEKCNSKK